MLVRHDYCPLLRYAAEVQRMLEAGLSLHQRFGTAQTEAYVIGRLRQRHGCPGPGRAMHCPWQQWHAGEMVLDEAVPHVGTERDDGRPW